MNKRLAAVMMTWPFALSLGCLLLNDWVLKAAYGNFLTGKLSDFAGIAVVAMLLLAASPNRKLTVYVGLSLFFLWWKSPASDAFIQAFNQLNLLPIGRVVDYTDLAALTVLPVCNCVACDVARFSMARVVSKRFLLFPLAVATLIGITGTSIPHMQQKYTIQNNASEDLKRVEIANTINATALKNGLTCIECADPTQKATYLSESKWTSPITLSYTFISSKAIEFRISAASTKGVFFGGESADERISRLREPIKNALATRFKNLEYVEALGVGR